MNSNDVGLYIDMAMVARVGQLLSTGRFRDAEAIATEHGIDDLASFLTEE